jgi:hypothetical protein
VGLPGRHANENGCDSPRCQSLHRDIYKLNLGFIEIRIPAGGSADESLRGRALGYKLGDMLGAGCCGAGAGEGTGAGDGAGVAV